MLELWPFTNFHDLNLDWIIKTIKVYTKKVDDFITNITEAWNNFKEWTTGEIGQMHEDFAHYVDATEEALNTGAIANGAITKPKIDSDFLREIENFYVTPEMFGATGDGVTDDSSAMISALASGKDVYLGNNTYYITQTLPISDAIIFNGSIHFKSVSGVVKNGFTCSGKCRFLNVEIYSDRDQAAVTFADTVQSSNIIAVSASSGGDVELDNCLLHDLEYGIKADTDDSLQLSINNITVEDTMMPLYCSTSYIDANNSTFESIATNTLYHPAYMKTATIMNHEFNNCRFLSTNTSFQYYNDQTTPTGTAYINNCYFQKHFIDYKGNCVVRASSIDGAANYGGTFYNCFVATVLTNDNVDKNLYNCTITRYVMSTFANATTGLYNCAMNFSNLSQSPIQLSAGNVTFANCTLRAAYESNMIRLSGTAAMNLENCMIERPGAANSRIYFTASGTPSTLVIGNTVHANDTNFPTTSGNTVVGY